MSSLSDFICYAIVSITMCAGMWGLTATVAMVILHDWLWNELMWTTGDYGVVAVGGLMLGLLTWMSETVTRQTVNGLVKRVRKLTPLVEAPTESESESDKED